MERLLGEAGPRGHDVRDEESALQENRAGRSEKVDANSKAKISRIKRGLLGIALMTKSKEWSAGHCPDVSTLQTIHQMEVY